jgi:Flp pilus assembly protein TadG
MKILRSNEGQSLVEFAIILPILLMLIMGILEFGIMLNSYLAVRNASREGARAAIVGSTDIEINNLILTISPSLNSTDLTVVVTPSASSRKSGDPITVEIQYNYQFTVPIISGIFGSGVVLKAQTIMRIE